MFFTARKGFWENFRISIGSKGRSMKLRIGAWSTFLNFIARTALRNIPPNSNESISGSALDRVRRKYCLLISKTLGKRYYHANSQHILAVISALFLVTGRGVF